MRGLSFTFASVGLLDGPIAGTCACVRRNHFYSTASGASLAELETTRAKGEAPLHQSARRAGASCGGVIRHIEARAGTPAAPTHDRNLSRVNSRCPRPSIGRERGVRSRAENISQTLTSALPEGVLSMPCAH